MQPRPIAETSSPWPPSLRLLKVIALSFRNACRISPRRVSLTKEDGCS
jgi:hypothetical protein